MQPTAEALQLAEDLYRRVKLVGILPLFSILAVSVGKEEWLVQ